MSSFSFHSINYTFLNQKNFFHSFSHSILQEINHHSPRGVFIITERDDGASISRLMMKNLTPTDTGLYSCYTSIENYASIMIHVFDSSG